MNEMVSVVVPVYHAEKYIEETMDCVCAQTYLNWEMLLVVDGPEDPTVEVIRKYLEKTGEKRIRLFIQDKNQGAALARNRGVAEAKGRYIAYLDADDLWMPDKLEKEVNFMKQKDAAFAFTGYEFADENGKGTGKVVKVPEKLTYKEALKNTCILEKRVVIYAIT